LLRVQLDRVRRAVAERVDQGLALARHRLASPRATPPYDGDPRFAVITVNFSTSRLLKLMLLTLGEQTVLDRVRRVVIVDNASRDDGPPFLRALAARARRVELVENHLFLTHARGMRTGLRLLDQVDREANLVVSIDTDVIFRRADALAAIAACFDDRDAAAAGELRHDLYPYPEAQASFLVVRRDVYARRDVAPWVDHGAPAYWLQRSLWRAGLRIADFPSNAGGYVLHRGRAGVAAAHTHRPLSAYATVEAREPHFMGIPGGAAIWAETEKRWADLLDRGAEDRLLGHLVERLS
jgi:hypothetical protein